ncbi:hypothetical protein GCM10010269_58020 [Streptomyces humidus]|uniref:Uncharacterized protein n=1 Tax=Streptomyces humidus TaxID=52259 RepID=A0A918L5Y3_9ACTN|nr:hypothetical protein [Streptomyces humidus]GGS11327.1 hypothetical protein GCM10010269_58020 [Streptomyces humidus]
MPTGSAPAPPVTAAPTTRHGWHKLLIGLFLLGRVARVPAAVDASTGGTPSGWWLVVWEVLALVLAAFAVSEWEILAATSWRMSVSQWICLVLFHVGLIGFLTSVLFQLL